METYRRKTIAALAGLVSAVGIAWAGPAEALSYDFSFQLTSVSVDLLGTGLHPGDMIQGSITHTSCVDQFCLDYYYPTSTLGEYYDLGIGLQMPLGAYSIQSTAGYNVNDLYIRNYSTYDQYDLTYYQPLGGASLTPVPATIGGDTVSYLQGASAGARLTLTDLDASVFDSGLIPDPLPPIGSFEETYFEIGITLDYFDSNNVEHTPIVFHAIADSTAIPEPSSALLVGLGVAVALGARRPGGQTA